MRASTTFFLGFAVGCSSGPLELSLPADLGETGTLALMIDDALYIADLENPPQGLARSIPIENDEHRLVLTELPCRPDAYGLQPGWQVLADVSDGPIGPAAASVGTAMASDVQGEDQFNWAPALDEVTRLTEALARTERSTEADCRYYFPEWELNQVVLRSTELDNLTFGVSHDAEAGLFGTRSGRLFLVSADSATEVTATASVGHIIGAARRGDVLWMMRSDASLVRGSVQQGFATFQRPDPPGHSANRRLRRAWLSWPPGEADDGPYLLTNRNALYHFDGATLARISEPDEKMFQSNLISGGLFAVGRMDLIVAEPGYWTAVFVATSPEDEVSTPGLRRFVNGEYTASTGELGVTSINGKSANEHLVGQRRGGLLVGSFDNYERLAAGMSSLVLAVEPYGAGWALAGESGFFSHFHPAAGFCGASTYGAGDIAYVVPAGDTLLLASRPRSAMEEDASIVRLEVADPARSVGCGERSE